jgi:hypothetical protein
LATRPSSSNGEILGAKEILLELSYINEPKLYDEVYGSYKTNFVKLTQGRIMLPYANQGVVVSMNKQHLVYHCKFFEEIIYPTIFGDFEVNTSMLVAFLSGEFDNLKC